MPFDRYLPCPGGTGKKIKFCCDDLLGELETIQRMLDGDQRLGCLEHVDKTLEKFPDRPCLLSVKTLLEAELGHDEELKKTLDHFQAKHPGNPVLLAERAMQAAEEDDERRAVDALQSAMDAIVDEQMPTRVYEALGVVGQVLLAKGRVVAGQAHLLAQATIAGEDDPQPVAMLSQVMRSSRVPLLLKEDLRLEEAPEDARWSEEFDEAKLLALRGAWRTAAGRFEELSQKAPQSAAILRNLALLRGCLAEEGAAARAWRAYAALNVPLDDAVEAEARAQLLDEDQSGDQVDVLAIEYGTSDFEALAVKFAADASSVRMPDGFLPPTTEEQPPPRAAYWLVDRPMPQTGVDLALADVPVVFGQCYLYGKETDRDARLEYVVYRDDRFDAARDALRQFAGEQLVGAGDERVLTQIGTLQNALTWNWRLPNDTPALHAQALLVEQRHDSILNKWPALPNPALDGKSPEEVAGDPAYRTRLLAAVLVIEMQAHDVFDFNELRRKLQLPVAGLIDGTDVDVGTLSLVRLARLDAERLSNDQLIEAYRRSVLTSSSAAVRQLAVELTRRESLAARVDMAEAYGLLAKLEGLSDRAVEYIGKARKAAAAAGRSPAIWYVAELPIRLERREGEEFERLLGRLQRHMKEPGIADAVAKVLMRYGFIGPDGRPVAPTGSAAAPAPEPSIIAPGAEPTPTSDIWTPGSEANAPQKKSAIWTPDD